MKLIAFARRNPVFIAFALALCINWASSAFAATTASTTISQEITQGNLTLTLSTSTVAMSAISVSGSTQLSYGTLSQVQIDDSRGTAAGWTLAMTLQNLTLTKNPEASSGNTSPLITLYSASRYDGSCGVSVPPMSYTVTVGTGGSVGTARYTVTNGCSGETNQTSSTTAATNNPVGSRGVAVDFPAGTYVANDSWTIRTDVYPHTSVYVTPQAATAGATNSDLTSVTEGSAATLSGSGTTSSSKNLLTAASGKGMGVYLQDSTIRLSVHAIPLSGIFSGTLTLTLS